MKKRLTLRMKLRYTFMFISVCAACPPLASETRYVFKNGGNTPPYTTPETAARTIQAALDVALLGDVVLIGPGDYEENITLRPDGLTLIGAGSDRSRIIAPAGSDSPAVSVETRSLVLRGFAVVGGRVGISSVPGKSARALIADCLVEGASESGLYLGGWTDTNVLDSVFRDVPTGIRGGDDASRGGGLLVSGCVFVRTDVAVFGAGVSTIDISQSVFLENRSGVYSGANLLVDSCKFLGGDYGIEAPVPDGAIEVSHSIFAFVRDAGLRSDSRGLVSDSLFYANGYAYDWLDGFHSAAFVRCTFVSNRLALGLRPQTARDCIFWNNVEDVPSTEGAETPYPETSIFDHCLINHPKFAGKNGNVCGDPGLVKWWRGFNESDNPIHVDSSALGVGDGSAERPFGSLQEALSSFELRLGEGSICVGAGALGGDIGYRAGTVPYVVEGSNRVAVEMAPGAYEVLQLAIPGSVTLRGEPGASQRPSIRVLLGDVWEGAPAAEEGARFCGLDFHDSALTACGAELSDCRFYDGGLGLDGSSAVGCQFFLAAGLGLGDTPCRISNCLIVGSTLPLLRAALYILSAEEPHHLINCTIIDEDMAIRLYWDEARLFARLTNCIVSGPVSDSPERLQADHSLFTDGWPGEGNIAGDPMFVDAEKGDFRLRAESPCIDARFNDVELPETDIAGMHRVMFGGKSLTVDMGAYEFYINEVKPGPDGDQTTFTWSSLADKTYSIFYTDDLLNWQTATENFPSSGNQTTSWTDDGSLTGLPPLLAPQRFYRLLENP